MLKINSLGKVAGSLYQDKLMACLPFLKDAAIQRQIQLGSELNIYHTACHFLVGGNEVGGGERGYVCLKDSTVLAYNDCGKTYSRLNVSETQS